MQQMTDDQGYELDRKTSDGFEFSALLADGTEELRLARSG
jgi:uncharacterized protein YfiM (DUF2279 family)